VDVIVGTNVNRVAVAIFVEAGFVDIDQRNLMILGKFDVIIDIGDAFSDPGGSNFRSKRVSFLGKGVFVGSDGGDHDNDHFRAFLDKCFYGGVESFSLGFETLV